MAGYRGGEDHEAGYRTTRQVTGPLGRVQERVQNQGKVQVLFNDGTHTH